MAIEKLIPKKEVYIFPRITYVTSKGYHYVGEGRPFHSQYEYWYDGVKMLIGRFKGGGLGLIEVETYAWAVQPDAKVDELIALFKEKVQKSGKTIHEVIRDYKSNNLDLELWLVNTLTI